MNSHKGNKPKPNKTNQMKTIKTNGATGIAALALLSLSLIVSVALKAAPPLSGAIFSTDSTCMKVNQNIYASKDTVFVDGGPASNQPGAAGLPDGSYCVQVTSPDGTVLGVSAPGAVTVSGGSFVLCYQLSLILNTASSGFTTPGYDDTNNPGGEYKVWVSTDCTFTNNSTKTDNFKVGPSTACVVTSTPCPTATPQGSSICVSKFYDANANGVQDAGEPNITGWEYCVVGNNNFSALRFTFNPTRCLVVAADDYCVTEGTPVETTWVHTTDTQVCFHLADGDPAKNVSFGNVCLGPGGGLTLGFWSNKNGQAMENCADFALLTSLWLRNANGSNQDFSALCTPSALTANRTALNSWLLNATAVNMAYMLSAQLAAMELNVSHHNVSGSALVYAPCLINTGTPGVNRRNSATFMRWRKCNHI
jgi:hypothetical protein